MQQSPSNDQAPDGAARRPRPGRISSVHRDHRRRDPSRLLDTYEAECRPITIWVRDWTQAQVARMRSDENVGLLREVIEPRLLGAEQAMTELVALASAIGLRFTVASTQGG